MSIRCGIVGLPNVGKSTSFNALTQAKIEVANYPFCTIEPNVGIVTVPDLRLNQISDIVKPEKIVPAVVEFVDIAGLVAGASKGEGLGNQFLANIRETQAIAHVVRCFEHTDIIHVSGKVDPIADIEVINTELALADLEAAERALQRLNKNSKAGNKDILEEKALLEQVLKHLNENLPIRSLNLSKEEKILLKPYQFLTLKPMFYIANVNEKGFVDNPLLDKINEYAAKENAEVVPICASLEQEIAELDSEDKLAFLAEMNLTEPGLNRVVRTAYQLLGLQTYFTAGVKEVRAWTIPIGATAPQAAGEIHTDFEKGFIRAEVIAYQDFIDFKGEQGAKEAGKKRLEGKTYIVQNGDIIHFLFNV